MPDGPSSRLGLPLIDREKDVVQCPEEPRAAPVRLESGWLERQESRDAVGVPALLRARHGAHFSV